jgi:glucose-fructose oxidoreductase
MRPLLCLLIGLFIFIPTANGAAQTGGNDHPKLRLGVVGFHHGHVLGFFHSYLNRSDIEIVGFAEPDRPLAENYTKRFKLPSDRVFFNVEEMIEKTHPQAVVTYTSTFDHRTVVETCAKHGVQVMMEKPLAVSLEDALAIQKAGREGKINVLVNYETSWYRSNHAAQELLQSGAIGELRKVVVHDGHRGPKEIGCGPEFLSWLTDPKLNGAGALFDFGCYGADLVTWLMDGRRPQTVSAVTQQIKPDIYPKVDDEATIIITYPKTQAILQASWNWPFDRKDMEVYGRTGSVFTIRGDDVRVRLPRGREETKAGKPLPSPYDDQISYLRGVVLDGAKVEPLSSIETNVTVVEILDAARESAKTGKTIHLPETR